MCQVIWEGVKECWSESKRQGVLHLAGTLRLLLLAVVLCCSLTENRQVTVQMDISAPNCALCVLPAKPASFRRNQSLVNTNCVDA